MIRIKIKETKVRERNLPAAFSKRISTSNSPNLLCYRSEDEARTRLGDGEELGGFLQFPQGFSPMMTTAGVLAFATDDRPSLTSRRFRRCSGDPTTGIACCGAYKHLDRRSPYAASQRDERVFYTRVSRYTSPLRVRRAITAIYSRRRARR